jgi:hypothetical protein
MRFSQMSRTHAAMKRQEPGNITDLWLINLNATPLGVILLAMHPA